MQMGRLEMMGRRWTLSKVRVSVPVHVSQAEAVHMSYLILEI